MIRVHLDTYETLVGLASYKDSMDEIIRRLLKESKWAKSRARGAGKMRALRRL